MSDVVKALLLSNNAPAPLEPLQLEVIHPDNIALEQRVRRARLLTQTNVFKLKLRRWVLSRQTRQYRALVPQAKTILSELKQAKANKDRLAFKRLTAQWRGIRQKLEVLKPAALEHREICKTLDAVMLARERYEEEKKQFGGLSTEARKWGTDIKLTWRDLPGCHHRYTNKKGKMIVEVPEFDQVVVTADAIYYKLAASGKGYFGSMRKLPYGVLVDNLIDEKVLLNMSVMAQRQVTHVTNTNGCWIVVNRLDSHDGLMDKVHYRQIMEIYPEEHRGNFTVCVGVGLYRMTKWVNFAHYPHWLIAGWTGGGKSNIVNVIISTLITHHSPDELRLVLLDLKGGVEFGSYQGIPHLIGNVIEDIEEIGGVLEQLEAEMARRLKLLRSKKKKVIEDYNRNTDEPLPRIIVFFDEFAAVTGQGDTTRRIKASLQQIVAKGRAIGIHVVASTQTPNVDTIPGIIKTNLSVRLVGRMPTSSASVTALGSGDASDLAAIPGRMIMMISEPEPIQTPLIDDDDIHDAIAIAKHFPAPKIPLELPAGRAHQQWTPERLIEFSLKHMGGNMGAYPIYEMIQDENLSRNQVIALVDKILEMPQPIQCQDKYYRIENQGRRSRYLVEVKDKVMETSIVRVEVAAAD